MDLRSVAPFIGLALVIASVSPPDESDGQAAPEQMAEARAPGTPVAGHGSDFSEADWSSSQDAVILERKTDGHFYAAAEVNGMPVHFLVDTGASMIALTGDDARALGLSWDSSELMHVGRGVNGDVMGKPVMLDRIAMGGFEFENMPAVIIPDGLDVSLLGQSFLKRVDNVQIERDRMTIGG